jgi:hypothetical protein
LRPIPTNATEPQIAPQARQCNRAFRYRSATAALASLKTSLRDHGFEVNRTPSGRTVFDTGLPDVIRTSTRDQCVFTSVARSIPSIGPKAFRRAPTSRDGGFCALRPASKTNRLKDISIEMWSPPQTCAALMPYILKFPTCWEHACRATFKGSLNNGVESTKTPGREPNSSSGAKVREEK